MGQYDSYKNSLYHIFDLAVDVLGDLHIRFNGIINCKITNAYCFIIQYEATGGDTYEERILIEDLFASDFPQCHIERRERREKIKEERKNLERKKAEFEEFEKIRKEKCEYERLKKIYG